MLVCCFIDRIVSVLLMDCSDVILRAKQFCSKALRFSEMLVSICSVVHHISPRILNLTYWGISVSKSAEVVMLLLSHHQMTVASPYNL